MDEKPSIKERAAAFFQQHRRRLARLALFIFLALVLVEVGGALPREARVSVPLGAEHAEVMEAHIDYSQNNESVRSVTYRWPDGAPAEVRDTFDVSPGAYDVSVSLRARDGSRRDLVGRMEAPAEGVIRLALRERREG